MTDGIQFIPLSPPTSPHMCAYSLTSDAEWHSQDLKSLIDPALESTDGGLGMFQHEGSAPTTETRPPLRTAKTYPYPLHRPSSHPTPLDSASSSPAPGERITISTIEGMDIHEIPQVTFGGSAPASPVSRLTPPSPELKTQADEVTDQHNGEDGEGDGEGEGEGDGDGDDDLVDEDMAEEAEPKQLTAQELRAQKRKMKRFRLTHNQTRFLMSEFARQAHPDAAHRERLSREIPGLSPRQVQVWFQNRRAKLKRLTSDDRERMMRSRALPDDFDMTQALHSPFGATPLASPAYPPNFSDGHAGHAGHPHGQHHGLMRPLSIDTLRRFPDSHMSPTGISPAFGAFNFTPPQSATDTLSPVSTSSEGPFTYPPGPMDSPRRSIPFNGSVTSSPAYTSHPQMPSRLNLHDRINRSSRAESLTSPLRTSLSYESLDGPHEAHSVPATSHYTSAADGPRSSHSHSSNGSMMPYGLGSSYSPIPGFQASAASRMRSFSGSVHVPRRIELSAHYTPSRSSTTPQTAGFPQYQHSPLSTPHWEQHLSAPHHIVSFQNSYLRHDVPSDAYPPVGSVLGEIADNQSHDGDHESHDGSLHQY